MNPKTFCIPYDHDCLRLTLDPARIRAVLEPSPAETAAGQSEQALVLDALAPD